MKRLTDLPAYIRWPLYVIIGVLLLTFVQDFGYNETNKLTSPGTGQAMLRWTVPILAAGLGGVFAERSGVVNIGLEGMMILGTWFGAWGAIQFDSATAGILIGVAGGALGGLLHAVATVSFGVDHIISGVAINLLGPGLTRFLSSTVFDSDDPKWDGGSITQSPRIPDFYVPFNGEEEVAVGLTAPFFAGGGIFGWDYWTIFGREEPIDVLKWLFGKDWFFISPLAGLFRGMMVNLSPATVVAFMLVPIAAYTLTRTRFGLRLSSAGEKPAAGESQGVDIIRYKYYAVVISGALAGFGGAFIASPELSGFYQEGQTTGRGFIGLAAVIFGNWRPGGVLAGALLFAYPFGLGLRDLDGSASHALLLVNAIILFVITVSALRKRTRAGRVDATIAGGLAAGALFWYVAATQNCATDADVCGSVPDWWVNIYPFVVVLIVLVLYSQRLRVPAAVGQPFRRGES